MQRQIQMAGDCWHHHHHGDRNDAEHELHASIRGTALRHWLSPFSSGEHQDAEKCCAPHHTHKPGPEPHKAASRVQFFTRPAQEAGEKGCATTIQETTLPLQDEKRENTNFKIDNLIHFRLFSHAYSFWGLKLLTKPLSFFLDTAKKVLVPKKLS